MSINLEQMTMCIKQEEYISGEIVVQWNPFLKGLAERNNSFVNTALTVS